MCCLAEDRKMLVSVINEHVLPDTVVGGEWTKLARMALAVAKAKYISATVWSSV